MEAKIIHELKEILGKDRVLDSLVDRTAYAYDATCTYEISQTCKVKNEGVLGTCSCCGSEFFLTGGAYPASGPAAAPLRQYNVSQVNSFTLRVYNN